MQGCSAYVKGSGLKAVANLLSSTTSTHTRGQLHLVPFLLQVQHGPAREGAPEETYNNVASRSIAKPTLWRARTNPGPHSLYVGTI